MLSFFLVHPELFFICSETGALCAMKEVELFPDDPKSAECIKQLEQVSFRTDNAFSESKDDRPVFGCSFVLSHNLGSVSGDQTSQQPSTSKHCAVFW